MDAEIVGVVSGLMLVFVLLGLLRNTAATESAVDVRAPRAEAEEETSDGDMWLKPAPELEAFLKELRHEKLLGPLRSWGARSVEDLKYLADDDLAELGVADDPAFRKALADIK